MKFNARLIIALLGVAVTLAVFAYYVRVHPSVMHQLARTPRMIVAQLLALYVLWVAALNWTVSASLRLCGVRLGAAESVLLNAYSTLVNFFVPGQGGPVVRGLYLKRRYGLLLRRYLAASLLYYICYALISVLLLLALSVPLWWTFGGVAMVAAASALVMRLYAKRAHDSPLALRLSPALLGGLLLATAGQAAVQVAIYALELRSVDPHVTISQAVTYTGAANFALFAALTPGAIGIRESFVLFSQQLHHIGTVTVVSASVIDRGVFLLLLGGLLTLTIGLHARERLRLGGRDS